MSDNAALRAEIEELQRQRRELRRLNDFLEVREAMLEEEVQAVKHESQSAREEAREARLKQEELATEIDHLKDCVVHREELLRRIVRQWTASRDKEIAYQKASGEKNSQIAMLQEKLRLAKKEIEELKKIYSSTSYVDISSSGLPDYSPISCVRHARGEIKVHYA
ncbi:hypothetical protein NMY22_g9773 [Coprinellus aureogranulatus]|nr:hypothetical protein NMY22_g9773 [Coprinellus aureogranulatus]